MTIRLGDRVVIVDPRRIIKIGYSTDIDTMTEIAKADIAVLEFCQKMRISGKCRNRVVRAIAASMLANELKSGAVRSIVFSEPDNTLIGREFYVVSKHVRFTGEYHAACGNYPYWGEYDYDPAYLSKRRAHIILELTGFRPTIGREFMAASKGYLDGLFVTSEQVLGCGR